MLLLSEAPKFVMHDIDGCLESLMYLVLRGRQNNGGGKSLKSTLRFCMAPSSAPVGCKITSLRLESKNLVN